MKNSIERERKKLFFSGTVNVRYYEDELGNVRLAAQPHGFPISQQNSSIVNNSIASSSLDDAFLDSINRKVIQFVEQYSI